MRITIKCGHCNPNNNIILKYDNMNQLQLPIVNHSYYVNSCHHYFIQSSLKINHGGNGKIYHQGKLKVSIKPKNYSKWRCSCIDFNFTRKFKFNLSNVNDTDKIVVFGF